MEQEQHKVYLAVPGNKFCWGTVTGVVNSTAKHIARPMNGGFCFSGQEDFNILLIDAINLYEAGEITHFAMLHGDIAPDESQHWLDILLEEMDARSASLVSVVSPIKDGRGLTSTGICDLNDPWRPYRRFTVRECLEKLPATFNNADAGYPDRPLLHNTGMWVADLRREVFRRANAAGELDLYFRFPTRAIRGDDGKWTHQRESEDWAFSRDLWLRGVRDTWATTKVRLNHEGKVMFGTYNAWGTSQDGDDDTAGKWRADKNALPLAMTQMLNFELGSACNLGHIHTDCPNMHRERYGSLDTARELTDDDIVACATRAYRELGFTGLVGWIYYNEPLLQAERMFRLMERIKVAVPEARFILWTNGTLIPEDVEQYKQFESIIISGYDERSLRGGERLSAGKINYRLIKEPVLDNRLARLEPESNDQACLRPFVEFIIDNHGNTHLCCYDWRGEGTLGNVLTGDFGDIATRWRNTLAEITGDKMAASAPEVCRNCGQRWMKYQCHDKGILARVKQYRAELIRQRQAVARPLAEAVDESGLVSANVT